MRVDCLDLQPVRPVHRLERFALVALTDAAEGHVEGLGVVDLLAVVE